jgi:hypothetical protein
VDPVLRQRLTGAAGDDGSGPPRAVILVEGVSDQAALNAVAAGRGLDLAAAQIRVVPMGGATNLGHFLERLGPSGLNLALAGLCDAGEEPGFRRSLRRAGLDPGPDRAGLERLGFFVCHADLEDELIRAVGPDAVEEVIAARGELRSLRRFQQEPAQRDRPRPAQFHRFIGARSGGKAAYDRLLAEEAVRLGQVPPPLAAVLSTVAPGPFPGAGLRS